MASYTPTDQFVRSLPEFQQDRQADPRHPSTSRQTAYPYNQVTTTEGGHQFEVDNTPGHERLRTAHRSGTYREISPNGRVVEVIRGNEHRYVRGGSTTTVDGTLDTKVSGASRSSVQGDSHSEVAGNQSAVVSGNQTTAVNGNSQVYTRGSLSHSAEGDATSVIKGNQTMTVEGNVTTITSGNRSVVVKKDDFESVEGSKSIVANTFKITGNTSFTVEYGDMLIEITANQARIKRKSSTHRIVINDKCVALRKDSDKYIYIDEDGTLYSHAAMIIGPPPTEY